MMARSVSCQYDKYALQLWISTELAPENQFYRAKMKIPAPKVVVKDTEIKLFHSTDDTTLISDGLEGSFK